MELKPHEILEVREMLFDFLGEEEKASFEIKYPNIEEWSKSVLLEKEKEMLGIYISGHPLDDYYDLIEQNVTAKSIDFMIEDETGEFRVRDKKQYCVGGLVETISVKTTRNGDNMAFITLEDVFGTLEVVVFPREYRQYSSIIQKNEKLLIKGTATVSEEEAKIFASTIETFDEIKRDLNAKNKELWVCFENEEAFNNNEEKLISILASNHGRTAAFVQLRQERKAKQMGEKCNVFVCDELIDDLKKLCGNDNVLVREKKQ